MGQARAYRRNMTTQVSFLHPASSHMLFHYTNCVAQSSCS